MPSTRSRHWLVRRLCDQPTNVLIGLHGLWASRPQSLISSGVKAPQWWRRGCDYFHHSHFAPQLSASITRQLQHVMPHLKHSLLTHEYDKHVQCFNFNLRNFFQTELQMRRKIVNSTFASYLTYKAKGRQVHRAAVVQAFMTSFSTHKHAAVQLRCEKSNSGHSVLTQMWITLHADDVAAFPSAGALMNAPINQNDCPAKFLVPDWSWYNPKGTATDLSPRK